ncbi:hypothetical protein MN608_05916 [Microdochium nivale]|nr:hypothetical protein MN608_05916 [Microdochium nivale]
MHPIAAGCNNVFLISVLSFRPRTASPESTSKSDFEVDAAYVECARAHRVPYQQGSLTSHHHEQIQQCADERSETRAKQTRALMRPASLEVHDVRAQSLEMTSGCPVGIRVETSATTRTM